MIDNFDINALPASLIDAAQTVRAWPFEEARRIVRRMKTKNAGDGHEPVVFQTGYGPSGLPHMGTFGEVVRTSMVRTAFRLLTADKVPTRLICFSDDMDGFRKVPDNVPNREMLHAHLDKPLSQVPDPFGDSESFAHHNNARLRAFLDRFGFDYTFVSATDAYRSGTFDATLLRMLEVYDDVMAIMLPTLGEARRQTYAPFLPISESGRVLQVPMLERYPERGTVVYADPDTAKKVEIPVTGGRVKCQWKADWALRWKALGISYEMSGKDLIDSVTQSSRICKALGGVPPEGFNFELFLDQDGRKISKSKGNAGLSVDDWLAYAGPESLSLFMYTKPRTAKRLYFDIIPRQVDDYYTFLGKYPAQADEERLNNPVWHIHTGNPPAGDMPVSFSLLLNLASAANAENKDSLWNYLIRYAPETSPATHPHLDRLAGYAVRYFHDFVKPAKRYRAADAREAAALRDLCDALAALDDTAAAEDIQSAVYGIGKAHAFEPLRLWFSALYETLLGQTSGPRFGSFVALYGIRETTALIERALSGDLVADTP